MKWNYGEYEKIKVTCKVFYAYHLFGTFPYFVQFFKRTLIWQFRDCHQAVFHFYLEISRLDNSTWVTKSLALGL